MSQIATQDIDEVTTAISALENRMGEKQSRVSHISSKAEVMRNFLIAEYLMAYRLLNSSGPFVEAYRITLRFSVCFLRTTSTFQCSVVPSPLSHR